MQCPHLHVKLTCVCVLGFAVFHPCDGPYHSEGVCDGVFPHTHQWTQPPGHGLFEEALWHRGCQVRVISVPLQRYYKPPTFPALYGLTILSRWLDPVFGWGILSNHNSQTPMEKLITVSYKCWLGDFVFMSFLRQTVMSPQTQTQKHHICCDNHKGMSWASCSMNVIKIYTPKLNPFLGYYKLGKKFEVTLLSHVSSVLPAASLKYYSKSLLKSVPLRKEKWY